MDIVFFTNSPEQQTELSTKLEDVGFEVFFVEATGVRVVIKDKLPPLDIVVPYNRV